MTQQVARHPARSRRRDVTRHRAWMIRAYALALGAGTQVFVLIAATEGFGGSVLAYDLGMGASWLLNLAVAEYMVRRRGIRRPVSRRVVPVAAQASPS